MDKVFVDANIFLEIFLHDRKKDECEQILVQCIQEGKNLVTSDFIIYSCLLKISRSGKDAMLKTAVAFFHSVPLAILRPSLETIYLAIENTDRYSLDIDDSLVISCMKESEITHLISLDRHFDKVKGISRISP